ncbi:MAG: hypothetical protein A3J07_01620 [Candidatus Doudnabacteria bacterium RIFCSPLOWO2_02_FULL_49_13]|uniref:Glycoside hydrolase family 42 N-terminal domain-containing protein n=1 Tax=Candidatus Doudnabacteria bacterium RIFCSPHIGHO2_12_FULL_48_16 TaxID=1817838 RepID=A0A1F5PLU8_9BACT|nr:MAG: hypothetical protein A3B77_01095 [Candidatus Doudnabacteria bacterium RIFCSPHIGHO2_02_FULL_49_24]OGE88838.1 MAG: hypothetical protein A2760_01450 [Candidatus Doudnabacteria bacterium RIFCSPHIGHO2_01_FULL_50_67]OGE90642.1 MAG: hypothetical protein A3E29_00715 [Candidatus Doudnabacteria bacterium RIFCSPHIGHO2_12_FULL_48_16]OGE96973.1 MAG: hypothetical protein A2990_02745 [Candidatus Doudnabacteria bacterium RIFCSPLOWO2_01_FULL_49_40]OGF02474.1 MAG: hypothetical protein A3H14_03255 [Candid
MKHKYLKLSGFIVLVFLAAGIFFYHQFQPATEFSWGLNFSQSRARELGFDPRQLYLDILSDLKPDKIRLSAYWNQIERQRGTYDFAEIDDFLNLARQYDTEVILVVGKKQPRWPECHVPSWARDLSEFEQQNAELEMVVAAINHFKSFEAVKIWQVQNEPLFGFGEMCPKANRDFLKEEIALVKSLDSRPVMVADSGEFGRWLPTATTGADLFGTTMYRVVRNDFTGYFRYPLPPAFFRIKAGVVQTFTPMRNLIGVELQAEPWLSDSVSKIDLNTQMALMNPKVFRENIEYAKAAGFHDNYLWGVEWWYWLAKQHNDWGMWALAKDLLSGKIE